MVNVTCNQTITSSFQYPFTSPHPLSVEVVGHNYAFIKLDQSSTLQVQGFTSEFYWAWIGLGFIRNSSGADITKSYTEILHKFVNSLVILDCRIMITEWVIRDTQNLVIDSTEFGRDGFCPILHVSGGSHKTSFIFSNNNISACQHPGIELPILHFRVSKRCSSLTIVNYSFIRLQGNSNFQTAPYATNKLPNDRRIISVNVTKDVDFDMLVEQCSFISNNQLILIPVNTLSKYQYCIGIVFVLLDSINITNNTATSKLVQLKCYCLDPTGNLDVTLNNLLVHANNVENTEQASAAGGLETSVFTFTKAEDVEITASSFTNNHGTPLTFKSNGDKTVLHLKGSIYFMHNTGVIGGACGLNNVMIRTDS